MLRYLPKQLRRHIYVTLSTKTAKTVYIIHQQSTNYYTILTKLFPLRVFCVLSPLSCVYNRKLF
jgi:hypothetical protein